MRFFGLRPQNDVKFVILNAMKDLFFIITLFLGKSKNKHFILCENKVKYNSNGCIYVKLCYIIVSSKVVRGEVS